MDSGARSRSLGSTFFAESKMSRSTRIALALTFTASVASTVTAEAQSAHAVKAPDSGFTPAQIAGLYQMVDPRGYADVLTAVTYLRLLPDGRSRLEGVAVSDVNGAIAAHTEIAAYHRTPWAIKGSAAGPELCFDVAGKSQCEQVERDPATNDLLLFSTTRPRGHADLRLHRIGAAPARIHS
jgi:hypothetical protein